MTARLLRLARRLFPALPCRRGTHGVLPAHRALLLADLEGDLAALVDDAEGRGLGRRGAAELVATRRLIDWLEGGDPPGPDATRYVETAVAGTPRGPDRGELARRDAYLAALGELGGDAAAPPDLRRAGEERTRVLLDLQGRKLRDRTEELGLTIGGLARRSGIDTVTLVAILFGLEEMRLGRWAELSEALGVPLSWLFEGIRLVPGRGPDEPGFYRPEPDPRGSAGGLDTPDRCSDGEGGDPR